MPAGGCVNLAAPLLGVHPGACTRPQGPTRRPTLPTAPAWAARAGKPPAAGGGGKGGGQGAGCWSHTHFAASELEASLLPMPETKREKQEAPRDVSPDAVNARKDSWGGDGLQGIPHMTRGSTGLKQTPQPHDPAQSQR